MKKKYLLEKFIIRKGESSILLILICSSVLIFMVLPMVTYIFEHMMIELLYQEIGDDLEINTYSIIQKLDSKALGRQVLMYDESFYEEINLMLERIEHPQLLSLKVVEIKKETNCIHMMLSMTLQTTLYRKTLGLERTHVFNYIFRLPMDG